MSEGKQSQNDRTGSVNSASGQKPTTRTLRIAMNGVTGRMGLRQHLLRSILPIREQGGVQLPDGSKVQVEPVLVGRNEARLAELAAAQQRSGEPWTAPAADEDFVPSADDESVEDSALHGRAAIERLLGGTLIDERPHPEQ